MAIGVVGNIRPSDVNVEDIDVYYSYTTDRTVVPNNIIKLPAQDLISTINYENNLLSGLYNINLPSANFNETGIYNVYIKPKEIKLKISDCGVLSSQPNVKGIIVDINQFPELQTRANSNDLAGFRIEYFDNIGNKIRNVFKIITSSNRCIPENNNNTNSNESITRYRFTENTISNLLFLTITPSNPTSVRPNIDPFFGVPTQDIIITNTFFKPVLLELEIVEHDEQTLAIGIFGNQTKTRKDGIITYYGPNNEIYKQYDSFAIEDESIEERVEVKRERTEIDITKNFEDLTNIS
jgi:hypothetical protein